MNKILLNSAGLSVKSILDTDFQFVFGSLSKDGS